MANQMAIADLLKEESVSWGYFISVDWVSGKVYGHTRLGDINHKGQIYKGVGDYGNVEAVSNDTKATPKNLAITLTGIKDDLLGEATGRYVKGKEVVVDWCVLDANEQVVGYREIFRGSIDRPVIVRGKNNTIRLEVTSHLNNWNKTGSGRFTDAYQRQQNNGDRGCAYVNYLPGRVIAWGDKFNPEALKR